MKIIFLVFSIVVSMECSSGQENHQMADLKGEHIDNLSLEMVSFWKNEGITLPMEETQSKDNNGKENPRKSKRQNKELSRKRKTGRKAKEARNLKGESKNDRTKKRNERREVNRRRKLFAKKLRNVRKTMNMESSKLEVKKGKQITNITDGCSKHKMKIGEFIGIEYSPGTSKTKCKDTVVTVKSGLLYVSCGLQFSKKGCKYESLKIKSKGIKEKICYKDVINITTTTNRVTLLRKRRKLKPSFESFGGLCIIEAVAKESPTTPSTPTTTTAPTSTNALSTTIAPTTTLAPTSAPKCSCGQFPKLTAPRIIGGEEAVPHSHPYIVNISINDKYRCGGSIISEDIIVSAAHCFKSDQYTLTKVTVSLGRHDLSQPNEPGAITIDIPLSDVVIHEDYNPVNLNNDIAMLKLKTSLKFNDYIQPICLPDKEKVYESRESIAAGWGKIQVEGPVSNILLQVTLNLITVEECQQMYSTLEYEVFDTNICTYTQAKGPCKGDSGGPLIDKKDEKWVLIGVVSWHHECDANLPSVYAATSKYIDWLNTNAGQTFCKP